MIKKIAKYIGIFILAVICLQFIMFFLPKAEIQKSTYLETPELTEEQKIEFTDKIPLSFALSSAYGGRFIDPVYFEVGIRSILGHALNYSEVTFLINLDRQSLAEIEYLAKRITAKPVNRRKNVYIYGNIPKINNYLQSNFPAIQIHKNTSDQLCGWAYFTLGWTGYFPKSCHNTIYFTGVRSLIWGWHSNFVERMAAANTQVFNAGYYFNKSITSEKLKQSIANGEGPWVFDIDDVLSYNIEIRDKWRQNN